MLRLYLRRTCDLWCGEAERVEIQVQRRMRKRPTTRELVGGIFIFGDPGKPAVQKSLGAVAKWQGMGLQNPHRRFDSASRLQIFAHKWQSSLSTRRFEGKSGSPRKRSRGARNAPRKADLRHQRGRRKRGKADPSTAARKLRGPPVGTTKLGKAPGGGAKERSSRFGPSRGGQAG